MTTLKRIFDRGRPCLLRAASLYLYGLEELARFEEDAGSLSFGSTTFG